MLHTLHTYSKTLATCAPKTKTIRIINIAWLYYYQQPFIYVYMKKTN